MKQPGNATQVPRAICACWLLTLCTLLSGCALTHETQRVFRLAKRTTQTEPRFFEYVRSDRVAQREARLLAEQAWAQVAEARPDVSPDYENGFLEGFADFLYRGGTGDPPLVPPRGYWHLRFLNQFGKTNIEDWYQGFRDGAADCRARGLRKMWVVPTSLMTSQSQQLAPITEPARDKHSSPTESSQELPSKVDLLQLEPAEGPPIPDATDKPTADSTSQSPEVEIIPPDQRSIELPDDFDLEVPQAPEQADSAAAAPESDNDATTIYFSDSDSPDQPNAAREPVEGQIEIDNQPFMEEPNDPDEDIFNFPTDDSEIEIDDFDFSPDDGNVLPDPFSMSIEPPDSEIPLRVPTPPLRQVSAQAPLTRNKNPPDDGIQTRGNATRQPARDRLQIVFEGPRVSGSAPPNHESGPSGVSDQPSPAEPLKLNTPQLFPRRQPHAKSLEDTLFEESVPARPMRMETTSRPTFSEIRANRRGEIGGRALPKATWKPEFARSKEVPLRVNPEKQTAPDVQPSGFEESLPMIIHRYQPPSQPDEDAPAVRWRIRD